MSFLLLRIDKTGQLKLSYVFMFRYIKAGYLNPSRF